MTTENAPSPPTFADPDWIVLPQISHHVLEVAEGPIHYVEAGQGKPLLLLHGGHGGWIHWMANIAALACHRRVIAIDMPGFGGSYRPQQTLSLEDYASAVISVTSRLSLPQCDLAGFSFGAAVASMVAAHASERFASLTLVSPPRIGQPSPESAALPARSSARAKTHGMRAGVENTLRELMLSDPARMSEPLIDLMLQYARRTRFATHLVSRGSNTLALLEQVPLRALVVIGALDPYQRHELAERTLRVNRALRQECTIVMGEASHWVQYDRSEPFNRLLIEFLQSA